MRKLLDTNLVIRFLIKDSPPKARAVKKILESEGEEIILTDVGLAEIVWVLTSYYQLSKVEVVDKLLDLLSLKTIQANKHILVKALKLYQSLNVDFIDAYLGAYAENIGVKDVYSFDKDFDKIPEVNRLEPK